MTALHDYKSNQKILKKVVNACQHLLLSSNNATKTRRYLNSRLSDSEQISWQFGYFPDDENLPELLELVDKKDLEKLNMYYPKFLAGGWAPHGHFSEHNLLMPFHSVHGDVAAVLGRSLLSDDERQEVQLQKYKYNAGCQKDLYVYGLDRARQSIIEKDFVIGVEGQFDCIALHSNGITNAVAFGWANLSKYQMFQIHRYTNNVILMFDNDEAGKRAKKSVKNRYKDHANIKTISPPEGFKDIDEFFRGSKDKEYVKFVIDKISNLGERNEQKN